MRKTYIILPILLLILLLPFGLWFIGKSQSLHIAIINKVAVDESYEDHRGITWALNHFKVKTPANKIFDPSRDFYGAFIDEENDKDFYPLLNDYTKMDVIYLANTVKNSSITTDSKESGGLDELEWQRILRRLETKEPSLFIAESNTISSPTSEKVRTLVTKQMGVDWTGWKGRYFEVANPQKNKEIPEWIRKKYNDQWIYEGAGFLLINEEKGSVVLLEMDKHVSSGEIDVMFTDKAKEVYNITGSHPYNSWFDIVTPAKDGQSIARYDWSLTEEGKQMLEKKGIPAQFDAVIQKRKGLSENLYFAGNFNRLEQTPHLYKARGIEHIYKLLNRTSDDSFYWSTFIPMMKAILNQFGKTEEVLTKEPIQTGVKMDSRINEGYLEVLQNGEWTPMTIKGVNIGMGKPGAFPGEAAITEEEYYRWFQQIGEMNSNTIRVYTLHPPGFYHALKTYNEGHDQPLYVMHGVWINEENLEESLDAFEKENLEDFRKEMKQLVDVIHGDANVPPRPGHASGIYNSDISKWVTAWMIGIEWYPFMVENTNKIHSSLGEYEGKYFETKSAQAFEYWLAEQMDILVTYEMDNYNQIRPMSFVNWVTTDPLHHPSDASGQEDIVSVNPNLIYTRGEMENAGQFASYHVYPYYPDFINYEKTYREYIDFRGKKNNYAAYLKDLHAAHRMPVLIAEFGIPASRGKAHENPSGWNQGFMSEIQQGETLTHLYEDILHEQMMGGLVFSWQDEWFKRTWNTSDYDNPDRRPFWSNIQTNEQKFGLMSFESLKIKIDGTKEDWPKSPIYEKKQGPLKGLYVDHDETYLYIRLDYDEEKVNTNEFPIIVFDTIPEIGNKEIERVNGIRFSNGLEFIAKITGNNSRMLINPHYDLFHYDYGKDVGFVPDPAKKDLTGQFVPMHYALNKKYLIKNEDILIPFSSYETGKLKEGNGNPESPVYDSLTDYRMKDGLLELRIPWMLLQAKDPSKKEFTGDLAIDGVKSSVFIDGIQIGALLTTKDGNVLDSFPEIDRKKVNPLKSYTWNNWQEPTHEERLKQSYDYLQKAFERK
ncbi:hypothetical protein DV702_07200 [Sporosarcina sp. PTS2304]|uniref:hypothetical protein n=1 Tax=Sporosarcina sp. PTS2304 TaxID=2283194 RepID=UPI000E0D1FE1|nr:hypothetical protein [Sporosarcina sp. PTS2304]AXH99553.1 hypothetical protein DV702_07200 [Sporosarcina sp. PTS2304]